MNAIDETLAPLRQTMVDCQLRTFDVTNHAVLARMAAVPRELFLSENLRPLAYSDSAIEVVSGNARRRLLAPMVLARLLQGAEIEADDTVLCVGGGSGYGAAIAAGLAQSVVSLEDEPGFAAMAQAGFSALGLANAQTATGALDRGWGSAAPFDVIVVEGAMEGGPSALLDQLAEGGRLVGIETLPGASQSGAGRAVCYEKTGGVFGSKRLFSCNAPTLTGFAPARQFSF